MQLSKKLPATEINPDWTLYDLLLQRVLRDPKAVTIQYKNPQNGEFTKLTAEEILQKVQRLACGLIKLGVKKGDRVSIMSHTRLEWTLLDFAILACGAQTVPIYETSAAEQISYIVNDAEVKYAFVETVDLAEKFAGLNVTVRVIEENAIDEIIALGENVDLAEIDAIQKTLNSNDLCTIVYTSGSTGVPKGVVLSHGKYLAVAYNTQIVLPEIVLAEECNLLLFLPLAHSFARFCQFAIISCQAVLTLSSSIKDLVEDLAIAKPTVLLGVPRVFEKVYNMASHKAGTGAQKIVFSQAVKVAIKYSKALESGTVSQRLKAQHIVYQKLVFDRILHVLGGKAKFAVCGGAPLNPEVSHFFRGAGLNVLEGYGMTETVAPICVNRPLANKIGTIGIPFPGVEARVTKDGELVLNTPYTFLEYNNQPEATAETLLNVCPEWVTTTGKIEKYSEKWLATGDLAEIDDDGFIKITGRKKEIIVTAGGKNVSPTGLEGVIDATPLVANSVVIGDTKPFIAALITLDMDEVNMWCDRLDRPHFAGISAASEDPAIHAEVQRAVDKANLSVSRAESIRKFHILDTNFSEDSGTLTPSMKIRRKSIVAKFADVINSEIYSVRKS